MEQQQHNIQFGPFWKDKNQNKLISQQLKQAYFETQHISQFYIFAYHQFNMSFDPNLQKHVKFIISIGKGFPLTPPMVHFANTFTQPSLCSYSDYLTTIIQDDWSPDFKLKLITDNIPIFLLKLQKQQNAIKFALKYGHYYSHISYSYRFIKHLTTSSSQIAFQTTQQKVIMYVMVITSTHFILYKPKFQPSVVNNKLIVPKENQIDAMNISFIAELSALFQISHNRTEKNEYTFTFKGQQQKNNILSFRKKLKITKSTHLIELLIKSFKNYKGSIDLQSGHLTEKTEEVHLFLEAKRLEQLLKHQVNKKTIHGVNGIYQKLIELYSSLELPYQQIYLRKVSQLFHRQDIKQVMGNSSLSPKREQQILM